MGQTYHRLVTHLLFELPAISSPLRGEDQGEENSCIRMVRYEPPRPKWAEWPRANLHTYLALHTTEGGRRIA